MDLSKKQIRKGTSSKQSEKQLTSDFRPWAFNKSLAGVSNQGKGKIPKNSTYDRDPSQGWDALRDGGQVVEELGSPLGLAVGLNLVDLVRGRLELERNRSF